MSVKSAYQFGSCQTLEQEYCFRRFSKHKVGISFPFPGELLTPNVALRGNATQSTTYTEAGWAASPFVASYANDGSTEAGMTRTNMACSRTSNIPPVWWQVDLQKVYDITKVAITHWNYGE